MDTQVRPLALVETVRCLECGRVYGKPVEGGTASRNPGCPACGYVGWLPVRLPPPAPRRSVVDRLLRPSWQPR